METGYLRADLIVRTLAERHKEDVFMTQVKTGPSVSGLRIFDAIGIKKSWAHPLYHGYEIKVSRSDFKKDDKWPLYLDFCHSLSFVCPKGMIQLDELPEEVGLIYYNEQTKQLRTVRKAAYRSIEIPRSMLEYIIMAKVDSDRHPFFSSTREYLEAWVADRIVRRQLSHNVQSKLRMELKKLEMKEQEMEQKHWSVEREQDQLLRMKEELANYGVDISEWGWKNKLKSVLVGHVPNSIQERIDHIQHEVFELKRQIDSQTG